MSPKSLIALDARYIIPITAPPLEDGVLLLDGKQIVGLGQTLSEVLSAGKPQYDLATPVERISLGNVAVLPGLVNAHTHLEFSQLERPLGTARMPFPTWIQTVVEKRRGEAESLSEEGLAAQQASAITAGISELVRNGTTAVGEIATGPWSAAALEASGRENAPRLDATIFYELIGMGQSRIEQVVQAAKQHLDRAKGQSAWRAGLSPHAPYTVHPELLRSAVDLAIERDVPLAMHLAESPEELRLLSHADGPFVEMMQAIGAWNPERFPRGLRVMDYLRELASAPRSLVIHGNYLADDEIAFIAQQRRTMTLVYCPRTHAYFGHAPYPLKKMLDAGVRVALGTDSRASNPDLGLLAEMRLIARQFDLPGELILRLGTLAGAEALGIDAQVGSLESGKLANLALVRLPDSSGAEDPYELLLQHDEPVIATWIQGQPHTAQGNGPRA